MNTFRTKKTSQKRKSPPKKKHPHSSPEITPHSQTKVIPHKQIIPKFPLKFISDGCLGGGFGIGTRGARDLPQSLGTRNASSIRRFGKTKNQQKMLEKIKVKEWRLFFNDEIFQFLMWRGSVNFPFE